MIRLLMQYIYQVPTILFISDNFRDKLDDPSSMLSHFMLFFYWFPSIFFVKKNFIFTFFIGL